MVSFLLIVSFILHVIAFLAIIILYQRCTQGNTQQANEFEEMFQKYLNEFRNENRRLQNELEQSNSVRLNKNREEIEADSTYKDLLSDYDQHDGDEVETSLTANILSLANQGYTIDEIAKELKCGKTEAELIIKFYQDKTHKA